MQRSLVLVGQVKVEAAAVRVIPLGRVRAIKVTMPRRFGRSGSGSSFDRDVYVAQQHGPLAEFLVP